MPKANKLHTDKLLSEISVKYSNSEYIADRVAPSVVVKKSSDLYRVYDKHYRLPDTLRAVGGLSRENDFDVSTASYSLQFHGLKQYVADIAAENYDMFDLKVDAVEELTERMMLRKEKLVADLFTTTGWSQGESLAAAGLWTLATTAANPISSFDTGTSVIQANSGVMPNYAIIPRDSFVACKNNSNILDRVKYTSREINVNIIGGLLGISEILVPNNQIDTALEGASATAEASVWTNDFVFMGYKPPRPSPNAVSSVYMFKKNRPLVKRWRDEEREAEAIELNMEIQPKIIASLTGYYINNAI